MIYAASRTLVPGVRTVRIGGWLAAGHLTAGGVECGAHVGSECGSRSDGCNSDKRQQDCFFCVLNAVIVAEESKQMLHILPPMTRQVWPGPGAREPRGPI